MSYSTGIIQGKSVQLSLLKAEDAELGTGAALVAADPEEFVILVESTPSQGYIIRDPEVFVGNMMAAVLNLEPFIHSIRDAIEGNGDLVTSSAHLVDALERIMEGK